MKNDQHLGWCAWGRKQEVAPALGGGEAETGGRPREGASEASLRKFSSFYKGFFPHSAIYLKIDFFMNFHLRY